MPRVLLSHAFLKEGKDDLAAENALRAILVRDPAHQEARNNLAVLLYRQGRKVEGPGTDGITLAGLYQAACSNPSDLKEHVPTLAALARECRHITELGSRTPLSTTAFLFAQPHRLITYGLRRLPEINQLEILAGCTKFTFQQANVLQVEIEETDLLFLNSWHVYEQLKEELRLHAAKARKYIVVAGTTKFGQEGEGVGDNQRGLMPAIEEFVAQGQFQVKEQFPSPFGLTVLVRKVDPT
jgi:hypothetical protein